MKPDVLVELKSLRLHGMAGAWADLLEQGGNACKRRSGSALIRRRDGGFMA